MKKRQFLPGQVFVNALGSVYIHHVTPDGAVAISTNQPRPGLDAGLSHIGADELSAAIDHGAGMALSDVSWHDAFHAEQAALTAAREAAEAENPPDPDAAPPVPAAMPAGLVLA